MYVVKAPFRADQVGSILRTEAIKQARLDKASGKITDTELRAIEDQEIKYIVEKQKEAGLKAVTDGEFRRAWWHFDFLEGLEGVEGYDADTGIQFANVQTKTHSVKIVAPIRFENHPMLADYRFLHSIAGDDVVAKMTIPSPAMLHYRGDIEYAPYIADKSLFLKDLATAYKKAIQAFYEAGCRYLQLDDTSWSYLCSDEQREVVRSRGFDPDELQKVYKDLINEAISEKPADMVITMHICRGNFRSTWIASGGYEPVAETLFGGLNIDGFFLEYDNDRSGDFAPLRYVKRPDLKIILGLITSKNGVLEDPDAIKARIQEASEFVPLSQLCLSPQCGFASTEEGNVLTEAEQWAKLAHVVSIANDVWNEQ
ncbi:5-methyltetrahydropteroyltriglutamate--homocysteine S-methyltransferase [Listeria booriae]|nr:5-methyltetrahydropteroyltriglutamate--homocysteine S-methyltransferase [Listeria booriae]MBC1514122.1 5-methyltetrahydropteroyltriglutamate--homocysteine S-methyltransferase [Listeria booriae]MBC6153188.1 5-methyltetrahydropteroyltriglutamate--homocysteine S-methyltransferase [Listeria booriae]MBC6307527.1 5-methyltetrahydropteroyltriglutamate--homocysteine S-methyltransferase [Listeria booriae]